MALSPRLVSLLFAAGTLLGVACTGPLPGSEDSDSDAETAGDCPIGSLNCLCTNGGACNDGLVCAQSVCTPGPDPSSTGGTTTGDMPTTTEIGESTTELSACEPGGDGDVDPACPSNQPYCVAGDCVDCSGIDCAAVSPSLPMCDGNTGLCAACLCDDASPVCNPEDHTCSQCTAHSQCPSSACDLWSGACFPVADAVWVDAADAACDDAAGGTADAPLCTLAEAFARVGAAPKAAHAVRVRPATYSIDAPLVVPAGGKVALVHATGGVDDPVVNVTAGASKVIAVDAGAAFLLDGVALAGGDADSDGLGCLKGQLWLDRLTMSGAGGHGVRADQCDLKLRRSVLVGNKGSGAFITTGEAHIENSYISSNGNSSGLGGVYLEGGASLVAVYTSFIDNATTPGFTASIGCNENPEDPANESVDVRNSVAINKGANTLCAGATVMTTGWSAPGMPAEAGATNIAIGFNELGNYLTADLQWPGVYRANKDTLLDQLAKWQAGDPDTDFDGDPRPSGDSSPDYAGADRISR